MSNFKSVGTWWNDRNVELIAIEGVIYALYGWDGESYRKSWKCAGEFNMDNSKEEYDIVPIYKEVAEDEYEVVGYEVR